MASHGAAWPGKFAAEVPATVQRGKAVTVPLECTDHDGDPVSIKIKRPPRHATLGPIRADRTVRLTPAPHFTGRTSFTFYAVSAGARSALAKAVAGFQVRHGIPSNGIVGSATSATS